MANTIKQKRGTSDPGASDLVVGELAINTTDGGVFTKTDGGTVVEVGAGGASAINDLSDAVTKDGGVTIGLGTGALANDDDSDNNNTALGYNALNTNTSGSENTALGYKALEACTSGGHNTCLGQESGDSITSAFLNTYVGSRCGRNNTTSSNNTGVGFMALEQLTTGQSNTAIGQRAGDLITTGTNLTCIGNGADPSSATASNEVTLGDSNVTSLRIPGLQSGASNGQVLTYNSTNGDIELADAGGGATEINGLSDAVTYDSGISIGLGTGALANDDGTDNNNTALGYNALNANTSGDDNTAVGFNAGKFLTTGRDNVLLGAQAGDAITTGQRNVICGYDAGSAQTTHSDNTLIGYMAGRNVNTNNHIAIGPSALSNTSYALERCIAIGNAALSVGGNDNVAVGYQANRLGSASTTQSTSLGNYAGFRNEGDDNTFIGYNAGVAVTTADDCTLLGSKAGDSITTGSNNIVVGYDADASSATVSNEITLGNSSVTKLRVPGLSVVAQAESFAIGGAIYENAQSISADYSITSGNNAMSAGPITIDSGVTVTVTSGCTWTVV